MPELQGIFRWRGAKETQKDAEKRKKEVKRLAEKNGVSAAEIIRNAIDLLLLTNKK
jgi:hypothetical protein